MQDLQIIAYNPFNSNTFACNALVSTVPGLIKCNHDDFDLLNYLDTNAKLVEKSYFALNSAAKLAVSVKQLNNYGLINLEFACVKCHHEDIVNNIIYLLNAKGQYHGLRVNLSNALIMAKVLVKLNKLITGSDETKEQLLVICPDLFESYNEEILAKVIKQIHKMANCKIALEVCSIDEINKWQNSAIDYLIVKGHESAGHSSNLTTFVFAQKLANTIKKPYFIEGGIGENTLFSLMLAKASGIVLNSVLSLCIESNAPVKLTNKIANADGSETYAVNFKDDFYYRYFNVMPNQYINLKSNDSLPCDHVDKNKLSTLLSTNNIAILGQDIAFAQHYYEISPTVSGLINYILNGYKITFAELQQTFPLSVNNELAKFHNTKYPIVQGAMTRVSDTSLFAKAVSDNGGLPFLALALMRKNEVEELLKSTKNTLAKNASWGVGLLGFIPAQIQNEQIEIILKYRPPFALIAGGRPDQALQLENNGINTYLHIPSPNLLKTSVEANCRKFIFEGQECGGHVGPRTSFVLWQSMIHELTKLINQGYVGSEFSVILAGGIHDELSSAMAASILAPLHKLKVKTGVLMGTAYLYTTEAVATGAIVANFQEKALECNETILLETANGHSIRCIKSPYFNYFKSVKRKLSGELKTKEEIRLELELMNLGRLRIASKGLNRNPQSAKLEPISLDRQWQDGMYMIGQVASLNKEIINMATLHDRVGNGGCNLINEYFKNKNNLSFNSPVIQFNSLPDDTNDNDIAIIGMSANFPKANNVENFWHNILNYVDAIEEIPQNHFNWKNYYSSNKTERDKIYSKWGGFLDYSEFNPKSYGIPPKSLPFIDPVQLMALDLVSKALVDANYHQGVPDKTKTSVIVAHAGHGPITALYSLRSMLEWKLQDLPKTLKQKIYDSLPEWNEDVFPGYLSNVIAGRVANRFDFSGINFSIDAACASSLAGLYTAILELRSKNSDLVILAGIDTHNQPGDYLSFSKTFALSPTGKCKTFDASADGIVISEGLGVIILKRLSEAVKDGDRIYARIKGIGGSSDGRDLSLTAPRIEGQILALQRAYTDAHISPGDIRMVEAHGTGTVAGDKAEIESLSKVYRVNSTKRNCAIGSVKTMIGHTKAAAGLASLLKVSKSLYHKVLPASLHVTQPVINFKESNFYLNTKNKPWISDSFNLKSNYSENSRKAAISAFGFGGTNYHCILEEHNDNMENQSPFKYLNNEMFVFKALSLKQLQKNIDNFKQKLLDLSENNQDQFVNLAYWTYLKTLELSDCELNKPVYNACIIANNHVTLDRKINELLINLDKPEYINVNQGIYYKIQTEPPKIAFLFPGQGSQYPNMLSELVQQFPVVRKTFELGNYLLQDRFDTAFSDFIFPASAFNKDDLNEQIIKLSNTLIAQPAMAIADLGSFKLMKLFNVVPSMLAGHSFGEYIALNASSVIDDIDLINLSYSRGKILSGNESQGIMVACLADYKEIAKHINNPNISIANINSPNQCILAGPNIDIDNLMNNLKEFSFAKLKVSQPFHTKFMDFATNEFSCKLAQLNFRNSSAIPVYKNIDAKIYENDVSLIKNGLVQHITTPVNFVDLIQAMYKDGGRIFIEIGPNNVLTNLVKAILSNENIQALAIDNLNHGSIYQLQHTLANLFAHNHNIKLDLMYENRVNKIFNITAIKPTAKADYLINSFECIKSTESPKINNFINFVEENTVNSFSQINMDNKMDSQKNQSKPNINEFAHNNKVLPNNNLAITNDLNQVMLNYQNSMLEITKSFVESQKLVMLAYLQSKNPNHPELIKQINANIHSVVPNIKDDLNLAVNTNGDNLLLSSVRANNTIEQVQRLQPVNGDLAAAPYNFKISPNNHTINNNGNNGLNIIKNIDLCGKFLEIVSDRTGYPIDMLEPHLDIEADLGIDSIKRIEILNNFRKELPESTQKYLENNIEELASLKTIDSITDWIKNLDIGTDHNQHSLNNNLNDNIPTEAKTSGDLKKKSQSAKSLANDYINNLSRYILEPEIVEINNFNFHKEFSGLTLVFTDNPRLKPLLNKAFNNQGKLVFIENDSSLNDTLVTNEDNFSGFKVDFNNELALNKLYEVIIDQYKVVNNIFYLNGFLNASNNDITLVQKLFLVLKVFQPALINSLKLGHQPYLLALSFLGNVYQLLELNNNLEAPIINFQSGISPIIKSFAMEFGNIKAKIIDMNVTIDLTKLVHIISNEVNSYDDEFEIAYHDDKRYKVNNVLVKDLVTKIPEPLNENSTILVTGGARGITAQILKAIAKNYAPKIVIIGRSNLDYETTKFNLERYRNLNTEKEIKLNLIDECKSDGLPLNFIEIEKTTKAILKIKEIQNNLADIKQFAQSVEYYCIDLTSVSCMTQLQSLAVNHPSIDLIIHGSGIIEDAKINLKTLDSFTRVINTKVLSLENIFKYINTSSLKSIILFSSIVGRSGNSAQLDYCAANEILNKATYQIAKSKNINAKSIMWGPWSLGMARSELISIFNMYGWDVINVEDGVNACLAEIMNYDNKEVVLVNEVSPHIELNYPLIKQSQILSNTPMSFSMDKNIDVAEHIYLESHKFDNIPVMPFAVSLALMSEMVVSLFPNTKIVQYRNFKIPSGLVFNTNEKNINLSSKVLGKTKVYTDLLLKLAVNSNKHILKDHFVTQCRINNLNNYFTANNPLNSNFNSIINFELNQSEFINKKLPPSIAKIYNDMMFHGSVFQGIEEIDHLSAKFVTGVIKASRPNDCLLSAKSDDSWQFDPIAFDSAMQLAGVWAYEFLNLTVLPSGFESLTFYRDFNDTNYYVKVIINPETEFLELSCNLSIYNMKKELILYVQGLKGIGSKSLSRLAKSKANSHTPGNVF